MVSLIQFSFLPELHDVLILKSQMCSVCSLEQEHMGVRSCSEVLVMPLFLDHNPGNDRRKISHNPVSQLDWSGSRGGAAGAASARPSSFVPLSHVYQICFSRNL